MALDDDRYVGVGPAHAEPDHGEDERAVRVEAHEPGHRLEGRLRVVDRDLPRDEVRALARHARDQLDLEERVTEFDHAEDERHEDRQRDAELEECLASFVSSIAHGFASGVRVGLVPHRRGDANGDVTAREERP